MELKDINGRLEIVLPPALDLPAASELRDILLDALARDTAAELALDASEVERIATACVQVVLSAAHGFKGAARRLEIEHASEPFIAAFRHLGLAAELENMKA